MRKDYLKTIFFIIGALTFFFSVGIVLATLYKKLSSMELFSDETSMENFLEEENEPCEPIVVFVENGDETGEPQNI